MTKQMLRWFKMYKKYKTSSNKDIGKKNAAITLKILCCIATRLFLSMHILLHRSCVWAQKVPQ